jgi:hypothetical protein
MSIPFTQYLRPDGRKRPVLIERPAEIEALAKAIIDAGYRFEIEELTTGEASMEILKDVPDPDINDSLAMEICPNGPTVGDVLGVPESVDKMIRDATAALEAAKLIRDFTEGP